MSNWYPNDIQITQMSKWCPNDVQMISKSRPNYVQVMSKWWCPNDVQKMSNDVKTCMIIVHACTMLILHACIMIIVHACTMMKVHARPIIKVHECTMITTHACTMIKVHACTLVIAHAHAIVSTCLYYEHSPSIMSYRAHVERNWGRRVGGSGGDALRESRVLGGPQAPEWPTVSPDKTKY